MMINHLLSLRLTIAEKEQNYWPPTKANQLKGRKEQGSNTLQLQQMELELRECKGKPKTFRKSRDNMKD